MSDKKVTDITGKIVDREAEKAQAALHDGMRDLLRRGVAEIANGRGDEWIEAKVAVLVDLHDAMFAALMAPVKVNRPESMSDELFAEWQASFKAGIKVYHDRVVLAIFRALPGLLAE